MLGGGILAFFSAFSDGSGRERARLAICRGLMHRGDVLPLQLQCCSVYLNSDKNGCGRRFVIVGSKGLLVDLKLVILTGCVFERSEWINFILEE